MSEFGVKSGDRSPVFGVKRGAGVKRGTRAQSME